MSLKKWILVIALFYFLNIKSFAFAQSSYVLPYPSTMPGGISYKFHLVWEKIMQYWYFGSFGQLSYNLQESDKYLVEAKTLFDYRQYLLGYKALQKSDDYFSKTLPLLKQARFEHKNIDEKRKILVGAAKKHMEILQELRGKVPTSFLWQAEKSSPTSLPLSLTIQKSISLRNSYYERCK